MNKTVELVKLWGAYEEQNPDATLDNFFRYQLSLISKTPQKTDQQEKLIPDINGRLMILLRRIAKYHITYSNKALEGTGFDQIEEFGLLVTIFNEVNPIKSEAIYNNIIELSSGTNMLNRLKKRGLVSEYADTEDKRVKRLQVTPKGREALMIAKDKVQKVAKMMSYGLPDEDKQMCIQLLTPVNDRFNGMFQKQKNKSFDEIFREMTS
ncbi:MarR family winged helix-turn-helix transcriptional regulator [Mucilaginibacter sp. RCC_168]|uniref:MarR family winged helix-turn-helix transcriptional regulator n=1 Tax=Mucilaginibacter sp. RCC_168 TaxID=3239221 RepID=UPI00352620C5